MHDSYGTNIVALDKDSMTHEKATHDATSTITTTATTTTTTTTTPNSITFLRRRKTRLTVVVPEFGSLDHLQIMAKSIKKIKESLSTTDGYGFHCIIYAYKTQVIYETKKKLPFCDVQYSVGLWTHHMLKVPYIGSNDHVVILRDDVDIYTHSNDITSMLTQMSKHHYNVMSGASLSHFKAKNHPTHLSMKPREECKSHETSYTEIFFTIFDAKAWSCWKSQINVNVNPSGWGNDLTFGDVCRVKIGVMDDVFSFHNDPSGRTYSANAAFDEMNHWVDHVANVYEKKHDIVLPDYIEFDENDEEDVRRLSHFHLKDSSKMNKAELYRYRVLERYQNYPQCDEFHDEMK